MIKVCAKQKAAVVIMHMLGIPENMQNRIEYVNLMEDIAGYLKKSVDRAQAAGIGADKIIIDPGLGFGKTAGHNLEILKNLKDFKILGKPLLVGASRKSFIGKILGVNKEKINTGTLAASIIAAKNGADILRVHNVKETKEALKILDAIKNAA